MIPTASGLTRFHSGDAGGRVLVADDSPTDLSLLSAFMRKGGFEVVAVGNGADALAAVTVQAPDLILLDVQMPDMSGLDVCRGIKERETTRDIPVIFISGESDVTAKLGGFEAGGVDYITKPYRSAEVLVRARTHIDLYRSRREILFLNRRLTEANRELERLSNTDGLTGLNNRACYDHALEREWRRAHRDRVPLGLLMIDIDHFKAFNDTYGHPAGDACLQAVARAVQGVVHRPYDLVARYGGEELVILLPATPEEGCSLVARHVLAEVSALAIPHRRSTVADWVTVSIGVATVIPADISAKAQLVKAADRALYRAKEGGRNRIECDWWTGPV